MAPRTSIGRVKLKGLIFRRDQEIYVIVNATEPGFTTVVQISQVFQRMTGQNKRKFPLRRWNDRTMIDPVVRLCGDEFCTKRKGTYLAIAKRFGIRRYSTLAMIDVVSM